MTMLHEPTPTTAKVAYVKQTLLAQLDLETAEEREAAIAAAVASPPLYVVTATADDSSVSSWSLAESGATTPAIARSLAPPGAGDVIRTAAAMGDVAILRDLAVRWRDDSVWLEVDELGRTYCFLAACYGQTEALGLLLDMGCDFNFPNDGGFSPLFVALTHNHHEAVDMLRAHGAQLHPVWLRCLPCAESALSSCFVGCFVCFVPFAVSTVAHLLCRKMCCRRGTHTRAQIGEDMPLPPSPPLPPLPLLPPQALLPPPPPSPPREVDSPTAAKRP